MATLPANTPKILKPGEAAQASPAPLPPPGHVREEVLKQRTDSLQEYAETKAPVAEVIPEKAFDVDREIRQYLERNILEVTHRLPGYRYGWFFTGSHGTDITSKKIDGWEVVQGDMKEAEEMVGIDTTRRLGDCLLMRIPERRYQQLELRQQIMTKRRMGAGDDEFKGLVENYQRKYHSGVSVTVDDPEIIKRFGGDTPAQQVVAATTIDRMLRQGTVPGVAPGQS